MPHLTPGYSRVFGFCDQGENIFGCYTEQNDTDYTARARRAMLQTDYRVCSMNIRTHVRGTWLPGANASPRYRFLPIKIEAERLPPDTVCESPGGEAP